MPRRLPTVPLTSLLLGLALLLALALPAVAHPPRSGPGEAGEMPRAALGLAVHHGPVSVTLADEDSDGHQLGDLRVVSVATTDGNGAPIGRLDATLTTVALDVPAPGDEVRLSTLVFSFGDGGQDQLVVSGSSVYPAQGGTIAVGETTVRPIVGGSGRFSGASGMALSEHLEDDSWIHQLWLTPGRGRPMMHPGRSPIHLRPNVASPSPAASPEAVPPEGIVRFDLGLAEPGSAPGQQLGLWRYRIPAGSELVPHTHAGWQLAHIASGELTYTVIAGESVLLRGDGSEEAMGPGTYVLRPGDTVVEHPELEHFGANRGTEDVIILSATLYEQGAPLSLPLEEAGG